MNALATARIIAAKQVTSTRHAYEELWFEPKLDGDVDVSGNGLAVLRGGFVAILLDGFHGGFVERRGAGENFYGADAAGGIDSSVHGNVAGDVAKYGIGRGVGADGFDELWWNDGTAFEQ
jgi:hypothetical protein